MLFFVQKRTHIGQAHCTPLHNNKSPLSNKPLKSTWLVSQRCIEGMIKGTVYVYYMYKYTRDKDIITKNAEYPNIYLSA